MSFTPSLNTVASLKSTYGSPRGYQRSYKTNSPTLVFGNGSFSRSGSSSANKDNWILGKGASEHDGWDGWSVVQGEKRYWDSKLGKPEFRGKCGGAAANRLSEEKIIRKLGASSESVELPPGVRRTDMLLDERRKQIAAVSDQLFREYFPEIPLTPRSANAKGEGERNGGDSSSSARQQKKALRSESSPRGKQRRELKHLDKDELTPDIGSSDVDRSQKVVRKRQQQSIPEPPQRYNALAAANASSPRKEGFGGTEFAVPSPPRPVAYPYQSSYVSGGRKVPLHMATSLSNVHIGRDHVTQDDEPQRPRVRMGQIQVMKEVAEEQQSGGRNNRHSAVAPAGMPTNGTYHQHLPAVPSSPRQKL